MDVTGITDNYNQPIMHYFCTITIRFDKHPECKQTWHINAFDFGSMPNVFMLVFFPWHIANFIVEPFQLITNLQFSVLIYILLGMASGPEGERTFVIIDLLLFQKTIY